MTDNQLAFLTSLYNMPIREHHVELNVLSKDGYHIESIVGKATSGNINVNGKSAVRRTGSLSMVASQDTAQITNIENLISIEKLISIRTGLKNYTGMTPPVEEEGGQSSVIAQMFVSRIETRSGKSHSIGYININFNKQKKGEVKWNIFNMSGTSQIHLFIKTNCRNITLKNIQLRKTSNPNRNTIYELSSPADLPDINTEDANILKRYAQPKNISNYEIKEGSTIKIIPQPGSTALQPLFSVPAGTYELTAEVEIPFNYPAVTEDENNIVWFNQGEFVINSAQVSHGTNGTNISLNLKDKMSLLNGECGGTFSMGMTHSPIYNITEEGEVSKEPVLIRQLIKTLVKEHGQIPEDKIHISFDPGVVTGSGVDKVKNLVRWVGSYPIYGYAPSDNSFRFTAAVPTVASYDTYTFGDTMGYQYTDFVYPTESELSSNAGETVVSVLDKIKNVLGNYEYFFDVLGDFHFQPINNLLLQGVSANNIKDAIEGQQSLISASQTTSNIVYRFNDNEIVTTFSNSPKWANIKNDISIWGIRSDDKSSIQYHLVFDDKPDWDNTRNYTGVFYQDPYDITIWRLRPGNIRKSSNDISLSFTITDYRTWIYYNYVCNGVYHPDAKELQEYWPKIYDIVYKDSSEEWVTNGGRFKLLNYRDSRVYLNSMPYYYEIMDDASEQIKVSNIGRRTKALNDKNINTLFSIDAPNVVCIEAGRGSQTKDERDWAAAQQSPFIQLSNNFTKYIALGSAQNSAYETMRAMLNEVINYNESVSITCLPIYHIEPNTRITAQDEEAGILEETSFIVESYSIPLASNGTMTLQCIKDVNKL